MLELLNLLTVCCITDYEHDDFGFNAMTSIVTGLQCHEPNMQAYNLRGTL